MRKHLSLVITIIALGSLNVSGQTLADSIYQQNQKILKILESSSVSTQIFLGYRYFMEGNDHFNEFTVKRGYINFQKSLNKHLSGRITPDLTVDKEGDGKGDLEMRLKYCYMELKDDRNYGIFSNPRILVGQVFTPWLDFEEKINIYRVSGSHFVDKDTLMTSADFGLVSSMLIGGKIDDEYQKRVSSSYPGKYGSIAFGIFNGGGYSALENNKNKAFQWRVTLRPLPNNLPGLQLSYAGVIGKGNTDLNPDWNLHSGILTYESYYFTLTGQYVNSIGNYKGNFADSNGESYESNGYSAFGDIKLFKKKISLFGRFDYRETDRQNMIYKSRQEAVGIAYHIYGKNKVVLDFSHNTYNDSSFGVVEVMVELAL